MRTAKTIFPPITAWRTKAACLTAMLVIAVLSPQKANAGLSNCTVHSTQLMEPEHEQIIAVAPGTFEIGDFVGAFRYFVVTYNCQIDSPSSTQWGMREHYHPTTIKTEITLDEPPRVSRRLQLIRE